MKIYLIDDDSNVLNILKLIIQAKNLGEVCGFCSSPVDALEDLKYVKPDIVMVDLLMPGMDGISFVKKAGAEYRDIAYIMLSQVSNKEMISSAYEAGVEFFIQKPVNAIEVESVLTKVTQSLAMRRTLSGMQSLFMTQMQDNTSFHISLLYNRTAAGTAVLLFCLIMRCFSVLGLFCHAGLILTGMPMPGYNAC